jgi:hypothetical protein
MQSQAERLVSKVINSLAYFVSATKWVVRLGDFNIEDPSDDLYVQVTNCFSSLYFLWHYDIPHWSKVEYLLLPMRFA